jgi:hypothetical protein
VHAGLRHLGTDRLVIGPEMAGNRLTRSYLAIVLKIGTRVQVWNTSRISGKPNEISDLGDPTRAGDRAGHTLCASGEVDGERRQNNSRRRGQQPGRLDERPAAAGVS